MAKKRKKEGKKLSSKLIDEQKKKIIHLIQKGNYNKVGSATQVMLNEIQ
ncbi:MAG: hypothetical protein GY749_13225 [Desulfobacteraceae bacterium]|nr:hypothetical protein [Desulfobacteraceae bacterium]